MATDREGSRTLLQTITLGDGSTIDVEGVRDPDAGVDYDFEGALNNAGYVSVPNQATIDYYNETYGTNFASPEQYLQHVYGGGSIENTSQGNYFKTPNGVANTVNTPLDYNYDPGFDPGDLALGMIMAGAGAAAAGAAGVGGASAAEAGATAAATEGATGGLIGSSMPVATTASQFGPAAVTAEGIGAFGGVSTASMFPEAAALTGGMASLGGSVPSLTIDPWSMLAPTPTSVPTVQNTLPNVDSGPGFMEPTPMSGTEFPMPPGMEPPGAPMDPNWASPLTDIPPGGGSLVDSVIGWAKDNPMLESTGLSVAGGFIRGAMAPSPEEVAQAKAQADAQAAKELLDHKRQLGQVRGIDMGRLRPTGKVLRQSGQLPPGLINRQMTR